MIAVTDVALKKEIHDTVAREVKVFRSQQKMSPKTWKAALHNSMTSMEYMGGRKDLRETVTQRGFKLL
ncbi:NADPH-dependent oxidoreductase [Pseudomonas sp. S37]|nr:NADPH-dependent oxidoreductase [Pseudomonas sp. S37]